MCAAVDEPLNLDLCDFRREHTVTIGVLIALEPFDGFLRIRHIHMAGLAVRKRSNAKVFLFSGAFPVEHMHEAVLLFRKPLTSCLEPSFLSLQRSRFRADVQHELCKPGEDVVLFHLQCVDLCKQLVCLAENLAGLRVELNLIHKVHDF